jgi:Zn-dependent peptidase ImmA (M78 family)
MINDVNNSSKLTPYEKRKLIIGIRYVKIIVADLNYGNNEFLKKLNGLYIPPKRYKKVRYILISDKLSEVECRLTILHELSHLKDDILVNGDGLYSSTNELNVLDRDLTINKLMKN